MNRPIVEEVIDFVSSITSVPRRKISLSTRLGEDLGIDGEDAGELMSEFFSRFNVRAESFVFERYFGQEGIPLSFWFELLRGRWPGTTPPLVPITIGDLVLSAETGKWTVSSQTEEKERPRPNVQ